MERIAMVTYLDLSLKEFPVKFTKHLKKKNLHLRFTLHSFKILNTQEEGKT